MDATGQLKIQRSVFPAKAGTQTRQTVGRRPTSFLRSIPSQAWDDGGGGSNRTSNSVSWKLVDVAERIEAFVTQIFRSLLKKNRSNLLLFFLHQ